jgi:hypothetical protein
MWEHYTAITFLYWTISYYLQYLTDNQPGRNDSTSTDDDAIPVTNPTIIQDGSNNRDSPYYRRFTI